MTESGYERVDGVDVHWESRGSGTPLVVLPGGFGVLSSSAVDLLATTRRVVTIEVQGHGHTRDVDRPFTHEGFGDQVAGVIAGLGLGPVDLLGFSLGAEIALHAAQHPGAVRRLVLVAIPFRRDGYFPEVLADLQVSADAMLAQLVASPVAEGYRAVAPDPDAFASLVRKTHALLQVDFDWTEQVRALAVPTLLVYGDGDLVPVSHMAEFYALLGGGLREGGTAGEHLGRNRLAVLPGRTHNDVLDSPLLGPVVDAFLH